MYYGWSPYNYVLGNPILMIDPTGMSGEKADDYIYLNEAGDEIGRVKDKNVKNVTIVSNENLAKFNELKSSEFFGSGEVIEAAQKLGLTYELSGLLDVLKTSMKDYRNPYNDDGFLRWTDAINQNTPRYDLTNEWGGLLLKGQNGKISAGPSTQGYPPSHTNGVETSNTVGTFHTHPNYGKNPAKGPIGIHPFSHSGPSETDFGAFSPRHIWNIVLDPVNLHFYNSSKKTISLPLKSL